MINRRINCHLRTWYVFVLVCFFAIGAMAQSSSIFEVESAQVRTVNASERHVCDRAVVNGVLYLEDNSSLSTQSLDGDGDIYVRSLTQLDVKAGLSSFAGIIHLYSDKEERLTTEVNNLTVDGGELMIDGECCIWGELNVMSNANIEFTEGSSLRVGKNVCIYSDLSLNNNTLNFGGDIALGGDVFVDGSSHIVPEKEDFETVFCADRRVSYSVTGEFPLKDVRLAMAEEGKMTIEEGGELVLRGHLKGERGQLIGTVRFCKADKQLTIESSGDVLSETDIVIDMGSNFNSPSLIAKSSLKIHSLCSNNFCSLYIGNHNLTLMRRQIKPKNCQVVVGGKAADGGIEFPIEAGNELFVIAYSDAIKEVDGNIVYGEQRKTQMFGTAFTDRGNSVRFSLNYGYHYATETVKITEKSLWFYRVTTKRDIIVDKDQKTYKIVPTDSPKSFYPVVYDGNDWHVAGELQSKQAYFQGVTSGDLSCGMKIDVDRCTFVTTTSSCFDYNVWQKVGDDSGKLYKGTDISIYDYAIIKSGHTIKSTPFFNKSQFSTFKPVSIEIEKDAKLLIKNDDLFVDEANVSNSAICGDGVLEMHNSSKDKPNTSWTKYWDFSPFMLRGSGQFVFVNESAANPVITRFLKTPFLGNTILKGKPFQIGNINQDLFQRDVRIETNVDLVGEKIIFAKDITVAKGAVLTLSGPGEYIIMGSLKNEGRVICSDRSVLKVYGDVENSGELQCDGRLVMVGNKKSRIVGADNSMSVSCFVVDKEERSVEVDVETLFANETVNIEAKKGVAHIKHANESAMHVNLNCLSDGSLWLSNSRTLLTVQDLKGQLKVDNEASVRMDSFVHRCEWKVDMPTVELYNKAVVDIDKRFDMRGGRLTMGNGTRINIHGNEDIRFGAEMGDMSPTSRINILSGEKVEVRTDRRWGNVCIDNGTQAIVKGCDLMLKGSLTIEDGASLDVTEDNYGVDVGGDVNIKGDYLYRANETILSGREQSVYIQSGEIGSLRCIGINVKLQNDLAVRGRSISIIRGSVISGKSMILIGNDRQNAKIEGRIDHLEIDNAKGVALQTSQKYPMVIGEMLKLTQGELSIGDNILELTPDAQVVGEGKIQLKPSSVESGIRVFLNAEERRSVLLPMVEDNSSMPLMLNDVVANNTGSITISISDGTWCLSSVDMNIKEGSMSCSMKGTFNASYRPLYKPFASTWRYASGNVDGAGDDIRLKFNLKGQVAGYYTAGNVPTEEESHFVFETKRDIDNLLAFDKEDWIVRDEDGKEITDGIDGFEGGVLILKHNVKFASNTMNNLNFKATDIEDGVVLDMNKSTGNNLGYVSGKGTLKIQSSGAMPRGKFDDFFSVGGGTIEYGGDDSYSIMENRLNNVIVSGTGKKVVNSPEGVLVSGNLIIDGGGLSIMDKAALHVNKNLTIKKGKIEGKGELVLDGVNNQELSSSKKEIDICNLVIDNEIGVRCKSGINVKSLILKKGELAMEDNILTVTGSVAAEEGVYVSGKMRRWVNSGEIAQFPLGDTNRGGYLSLMSEEDCWCQAEYHNAPHIERTETMGNEYWEIKSEEGKDVIVRVLLRYEESEGYKNMVMMLRNGGHGSSSWEYVNSEVVSGYKDKGLLQTERMVWKPGTENPKVFALGRRHENGVFLWTGNKSSAWGDIENWKGGELPGKESEVVIPSEITRKPIVTESNIEVANIWIKEGASLSLVGKNATLKVRNHVVNGGELDLYYKYTQIPAFEYGGSIIGNKPCIYRTFQCDRGYYIGSATEEGTFENLLSLNEKGGDVLRHFVTADCSFTDVTYLSGRSLAEKTGSLLLDKVQHSTNGHNDNWVIQRGAPSRSGCQTVGPLSKGWHWLANPYPYTVSVRDFITVLEGKISPSLYARGYRSQNGNGGYLFYTYNIDGAITAAGCADEKLETLSPFEGVAIYCEADGTILLLSPNREESSARLKSAHLSERPNMLRITVGSGIMKDELIMIFKRGGSMTKHSSDSYKYAPQPRSSFEIFVNKGGQKMAIAYYPQVEDIAEGEVPFCIMPTREGSALPLLSIEGGNTFDDRYLVMLEDRLTGECVNLEACDHYLIPNVDRMYADRFALRFVLKETQSETAIKEIESEEHKDIAVKRVPGEVYDLMGRRILKNNTHISISGRRLLFAK